MDLRRRVRQWQARQRCAGCHRDLEIRQFVPNEHAGSPECYSDLCVLCQSAWADKAAHELADYFAALVRVGRLAA